MKKLEAKEKVVRKAQLAAPLVKYSNHRRNRDEIDLQLFRGASAL